MITVRTRPIWSASGYQQLSDDLHVEVRRNPQNLGYGGNQKAGYRRAIELGLDIIVLLHGDGQYAPELLPEMIAPLERNECDAVFGSRMMVDGAARKGGMPLYKLVGNKILTRIENAALGTRLSEFHSGYRAYRVDALKRLDLESYSDGFDFDTEIIIGLIDAGMGIAEIPIPTYYGDEICYVNGVRSARDVTMDVLRYRARKAGLGRPSHGSDAFAEYTLKESLDGSHRAIIDWMRRPPGRVLDLGCSSGLLSEELRRLGHHVVGVDVVQHPAAEERTDEFYEADLDRGLPPALTGQFDIILCADVLEHVRHPEALLGRVADTHDCPQPADRLDSKFRPLVPQGTNGSRAVRLRPAGNPRQRPCPLLHSPQLHALVPANRLEGRPTSNHRGSVRAPQWWLVGSSGGDGRAGGTSGVADDVRLSAPVRAGARSALRRSKESTMLISRTPLRISIGGGGTDLPSHYRRHGAMVVAGGHQQVHLRRHQRAPSSTTTSSSTPSSSGPSAIDDIHHPIVREALRITGSDRASRSSSMADIPSGTGLGSSGAFTVGLLRALYAFKREHITAGALAEEACRIEIDMLGQPVGKQDQYIAAFGGLTCFEFHPDDRVTVSPAGDRRCHPA